MLSYAVLTGVAAAYVTRALRVLGPIRSRVERRVKPWSCNVCMALWCSAACATATVAARGGPVWLDAVVIPAAAGIALAMLTWFDNQRPPPPAVLP